MQNRRNFIKNSILAVTGTGLARNTLKANAGKSADDQNPNLVHRILGRTGISIPVVSMGTGNTSNPNLIRAAYDRGVKLFATSEYYGNGNNEKMIGEALKGLPRDSYLISTGSMGGLSIDYKNGYFKEDTDPQVYIEHAHGCLERLKVDYVDIMQLGFGARREFIFYEPILEALSKFKDQGKARYLAIGTHSFEPEAIRATADTGIYDIVTVAYNFKKSNRKEIEEALQYAADAGLGIIAMKTMAGAYWDKEKTKPINTRAALKWVLQNENIHTTIPDCANFSQLEQDLAIMEDLELNEEERSDLLPPSEGLSSGLYCQQCHACIKQCMENLDIPTLMRSYMYAYGYKNLELARHTLDQAHLPEQPCISCNDCVVACTAGFHVRDKILDIARLKEIPRDIIVHV
jgi:aryl-alcohol dehydrogenase-like predicted oxidoreductase